MRRRATHRLYGWSGNCCWNCHNQQYLRFPIVLSIYRTTYHIYTNCRAYDLWHIRGVVRKQIKAKLEQLRLQIPLAYCFWSFGNWRCVVLQSSTVLLRHLFRMSAIKICGTNKTMRPLMSVDRIISATLVTSHKDRIPFNSVSVN